MKYRAIAYDLSGIGQNDFQFIILKIDDDKKIVQHLTETGWAAVAIDGSEFVDGNKALRLPKEDVVGVLQAVLEAQVSPVC